ncbi:MAG: hypothetical protein ACD_79C00565G0001, partial [uncultured bacterium]
INLLGNYSGEKELKFRLDVDFTKLGLTLTTEQINKIESLMNYEQFNELNDYLAGIGIELNTLFDSSTQMKVYEDGELLGTYSYDKNGLNSYLAEKNISLIDTEKENIVEYKEVSGGSFGRSITTSIDFTNYQNLRPYTYTQKYTEEIYDVVLGDLKVIDTLSQTMKSDLWSLNTRSDIQTDIRKAGIGVFNMPSRTDGSVGSSSISSRGNLILSSVQNDSKTSIKGMNFAVIYKNNEKLGMVINSLNKNEAGKTQGYNMPVSNGNTIETDFQHMEYNKFGVVTKGISYGQSKYMDDLGRTTIENSKTDHVAILDSLKVGDKYSTSYSFGGNQPTLVEVTEDSSITSEFGTKDYAASWALTNGYTEEALFEQDGKWFVKTTVLDLNYNNSSSHTNMEYNKTNGNVIESVPVWETIKDSNGNKFNNIKSIAANMSYIENSSYSYKPGNADKEITKGFGFSTFNSFGQVVDTTNVSVVMPEEILPQNASIIHMDLNINYLNSEISNFIYDPETNECRYIDSTGTEKVHVLKNVDKIAKLESGEEIFIDLNNDKINDVSVIDRSAIYTLNENLVKGLIPGFSTGASSANISYSSTHWAYDENNFKVETKVNPETLDYLDEFLLTKPDQTKENFSILDYYQYLDVRNTDMNNADNRLNFSNIKDGSYSRAMTFTLEGETKELSSENQSLTVYENDPSEANKIYATTVFDTGKVLHENLYTAISDIYLTLNETKLGELKAVLSSDGSYTVNNNGNAYKFIKLENTNLYYAAKIKGPGDSEWKNFSIENLNKTERDLLRTQSGFFTDFAIKVYDDEESKIKYLSSEDLKNQNNIDSLWFGGNMGSYSSDGLQKPRYVTASNNQIQMHSVITDSDTLNTTWGITFNKKKSDGTYFETLVQINGVTKSDVKAQDIQSAVLNSQDITLKESYKISGSTSYTKGSGKDYISTTGEKTNVIREVRSYEIMKAIAGKLMPVYKYDLTEGNSDALTTTPRYTSSYSISTLIYDNLTGNLLTTTKNTENYVFGIDKAISDNQNAYEVIRRYQPANFSMIKSFTNLMKENPGIIRKINQSTRNELTVAKNGQQKIAASDIKTYNLSSQAMTEGVVTDLKNYSYSESRVSYKYDKNANLIDAFGYSISLEINGENFNINNETNFRNYVKNLNLNYSEKDSLIRISNSTISIEAAVEFASDKGSITLDNEKRENLENLGIKNINLSRDYYIIQNDQALIAKNISAFTTDIGKQYSQIVSVDTNNDTILDAYQMPDGSFITDLKCDSNVNVTSYSSITTDNSGASILNKDSINLSALEEMNISKSMYLKMAENFLNRGTGNLREINDSILLSDKTYSNGFTLKTYTYDTRNRMNGITNVSHSESFDINKDKLISASDTNNTMGIINGKEVILQSVDTSLRYSYKKTENWELNSITEVRGYTFNNYNEKGKVISKIGYSTTETQKQHTILLKSGIVPIDANNEFNWKVKNEYQRDAQTGENYTEWIATASDNSSPKFKTTNYMYATTFYTELIEGSGEFVKKAETNVGVNQQYKFNNLTGSIDSERSSTSYTHKTIIYDYNKTNGLLTECYLGIYGASKAEKEIILPAWAGGDGIKKVQYNEEGEIRLDFSSTDTYAGLHNVSDENVLRNVNKNKTAGENQYWESRSYSFDSFDIFDGSAQVINNGFQTISFSDKAMLDIIPAKLSNGMTAAQIYESMLSNMVEIKNLDLNTNLLTLVLNNGEEIGIQLSETEIQNLRNGKTIDVGTERTNGKTIKIKGNEKDGVLKIDSVWDATNGDFVSYYIGILEKGKYTDQANDVVYVKQLSTKTETLNFANDTEAQTYFSNDPKIEFSQVEIFKNSLSVDIGFTNYNRDEHGKLMSVQKNVTQSYSYDLGEGEPVNYISDILKGNLKLTQEEIPNTDLTRFERISSPLGITFTNTLGADLNVEALNGKNYSWNSKTVDGYNVTKVINGQEYEIRGANVSASLQNTVTVVPHSSDNGYGYMGYEVHNITSTSFNLNKYENNYDENGNYINGYSESIGESIKGNIGYETFLGTNSKISDRNNSLSGFTSPLVKNNGTSSTNNENLGNIRWLSSQDMNSLNTIMKNISDKNGEQFSVNGKLYSLAVNPSDNVLSRSLGMQVYTGQYNGEKRLDNSINLNCNYSNEDVVKDSNNPSTRFERKSVSISLEKSTYKYAGEGHQLDQSTNGWSVSLRKQESADYTGYNPGHLISLSYTTSLTSYVNLFGEWKQKEKIENTNSFAVSERRTNTNNSTTTFNYEKNINGKSYLTSASSSFSSSSYDQGNDTATTSSGNSTYIIIKGESKLTKQTTTAVTREPSQTTIDKDLSVNDYRDVLLQDGKTVKDLAGLTSNQLKNLLINGSVLFKGNRIYLAGDSTEFNVTAKGGLGDVQIVVKENGKLENKTLKDIEMSYEEMTKLLIEGKFKKDGITVRLKDKRKNIDITIGEDTSKLSQMTNDQILQYIYNNTNITGIHYGVSVNQNICTTNTDSSVENNYYNVFGILAYQNKVTSSTSTTTTTTNLQIPKNTIPPVIGTSSVKDVSVPAIEFALNAEGKALEARTVELTDIQVTNSSSETRSEARWNALSERSEMQTIFSSSYNSGFSSTYVYTQGVSGNHEAWTTKETKTTGSSSTTYQYLAGKESGILTRAITRSVSNVSSLEYLRGNVVINGVTYRPDKSGERTWVPQSFTDTISTQKIINGVLKNDSITADTVNYSYLNLYSADIINGQTIILQPVEISYSHSVTNYGYDVQTGIVRADLSSKTSNTYKFRSLNGKDITNNLTVAMGLAKPFSEFALEGYGWDTYTLVVVNEKLLEKTKTSYMVSTPNSYQFTTDRNAVELTAYTNVNELGKYINQNISSDEPIKVPDGNVTLTVTKNENFYDSKGKLINFTSNAVSLMYKDDSGSFYGINGQTVENLVESAKVSFNNFNISLTEETANSKPVISFKLNNEIINIEADINNTNPKLIISDENSKKLKDGNILNVNFTKDIYEVKDGKPLLKKNISVYTSAPNEFYSEAKAIDSDNNGILDAIKLASGLTVTAITPGTGAVAYRVNLSDGSIISVDVNNNISELINVTSNDNAVNEPITDYLGISNELLNEIKDIYLNNKEVKDVAVKLSDNSVNSGFTVKSYTYDDAGRKLSVTSESKSENRDIERGHLLSTVQTKNDMVLIRGDEYVTKTKEFVTSYSYNKDITTGIWEEENISETVTETLSSYDDTGKCIEKSGSSKSSTFKYLTQTINAEITSIDSFNAAGQEGNNISWQKAGEVFTDSNNISWQEWKTTQRLNVSRSETTNVYAELAEGSGNFVKIASITSGLSKNYNFNTINGNVDRTKSTTTYNSKTIINEYDIKTGLLKDSYLGIYSPDNKNGEGLIPFILGGDGIEKVSYNKFGCAKLGYSVTETFSGVHSLNEWNNLRSTNINGTYTENNSWKARSYNFEAFEIFNGSAQVVWNGYQNVSFNDKTILDIIPAELSNGMNTLSIYQKMEKSFFNVSRVNGNKVTLEGKDGTDIVITLTQSEIANLKKGETIQVQSGSTLINIKGKPVSSDIAFEIDAVWDVTNGDFVKAYIDIATTGQYTDAQGNIAYITKLETKSGSVEFTNASDATQYLKDNPDIEFKTVEIKKNSISIEQGSSEQTRDVKGLLKSVEKYVPKSWNFDLGEGNEKDFRSALVSEQFSLNQGNVQNTNIPAYSKGLEKPLGIEFTKTQGEDLSLVNLSGKNYEAVSKTVDGFSQVIVNNGMELEVVSVVINQSRNNGITVAPHSSGSNFGYLGWEVHNIVSTTFNG